ncbi:MAG TPA: beta-ketoacyl synthase N-terminal-like domain-containing protein [Phycisphaerales bacterium]|nr:beta-ketoacyl synthase N-terminal-like domain-containing protein [Phycisphaerales bacterium]
MVANRREVVITGLGPITAAGVGLEAFWNALVEGKSLIRRIARFDPSGFPCQYAAELADEAFDVKSVVPKSYRKATKVMARDIELAVGAAASAVSDAGLVTKAVDPEKPATIRPERFGCQIGAGLIAADVDELSAALTTSRSADGRFDMAHWGQTGMQNLTPLWLLKYLPNMLACHVTIIHDCQGPSNTITCAETSAALSLGESMRVIQRGAADACLTGGAEHKTNPMGLLRQIYSGRLMRVEGEVADAGGLVKPFDEGANGTLLGEGGGILVVEAAATARARGAKVYARVSGFAATQSVLKDVSHARGVADDPGYEDAMRSAMEAASVNAEEVDAIVPFGSGTRDMDVMEAEAIAKVFGNRAKEVELITVIPNFGNCCAGAGALSIIAGAMAVREQKLPARLNTKNAKGLNANARGAKDAKLRNVLVMSSGMGGQNAGMVLSRID